MPYKDKKKNKEYQKEYNKKHYKEYYAKNKKSFKLNNDYNRKKDALAYFEEKQKYQCERCGEDHIACLEFHHLDSLEKDGNVSSLSRVSFKKALKEMDKCLVLCSNCHKKEHWEDGKIEKLKKDIKEIEEEINRKKSKREEKIKLCRICKRSRDEIEFVKGRCFCKKCYKQYQKNKMYQRRHS